MTREEAFVKLDAWAAQAASLIGDTEDSVVQDIRNRDRLVAMAVALKVDVIDAMAWTLRRLGHPEPERRTDSASDKDGGR